MSTRIHASLVVALLVTLMSSSLSARVSTDFRGFSQAELDQLLAPVALYPDTVLSHVLIAATYPLEVVQAARWTRQNGELRGEFAVEAVVGYPWDPSVMALVAFPELLDRMDADLDWTQRLGDAFLVQEGEVLDSIQRLRSQAYQAGHLGSNEHVQVVREREVIYIEPARRQVIYLPYYEPRVVYGRWHWADYPPVVWHYPRRHSASVVVSWSLGYRVAPTFFFSSFHWPRRELVVVHHHHHYYRPSRYPRPRTVVHQHFHSGRDIARHEAARRWQHQAEHRRGVAYRRDLPDRHRRNLATASDQWSSARSETRGQVSRPAETRSQQRQWAESRRSELDRAPARAPETGRRLIQRESIQPRRTPPGAGGSAQARIRGTQPRSSSARAASVPRSGEQGAVRAGRPLPGTRLQTRPPRQASPDVVRQRSTTPAEPRSRSVLRAASTRRESAPGRPSVSVPRPEVSGSAAPKVEARQDRPVRAPRATSPRQSTGSSDRAAARSGARAQRAAPDRLVSDRRATRRRE